MASSAAESEKRSPTKGDGGGADDGKKRKGVGRSVGKNTGGSPTISSPPAAKKPSFRPTIRYPSPAFEDAMELINSEPLDAGKIAAWAEKVGRWSKAHISGDIEKVWAVEEEEDREKYGAAFDDLQKMGELASDVGSDLDIDESSEEDEEEEEEEKGGFLCAIICDFLCDLPRSSHQLRDRKIIEKVLAECGKNHQTESQCPSDPPRKDTVQIDLRGLYSEDAQKALRRQLLRLSCGPQTFLKYLNVTVGCSMHGIGEGKLRQTVIDLLKSYKIFKWTEACNGAIISINLEDPVRWTAADFAENDVVEEVEAKEKPELCTVICDFLCDLPSFQRPDHRIAKKVLAGLKSCDRGDCGVDEETMCIDLRGLYVDDAEDVLIDHLYELTFQSTIKYLNVTVGCIVHGVGKRNLERAVVRVLMRDETIKWEEYYSGAVISIAIDRMKDYRAIGWKSTVIHEVQALSIVGI